MSHFFLTSGFFFSKKLKRCNNTAHLTRQYAKSTLLLYCIWFLISFPLLFSEYNQLYSDSTLKLILVLIRRFCLAGTAPYWYLLVLAEGVLITGFLYNYTIKVGHIACVAGLILWYIYNLQSNLHTSGFIYKAFYILFSWSNNVIMMGFPLLFLGTLLVEYEELLYKFNYIFLLPIFYIISLILAFLCFFINPSLTVIIPFGLVQAVLLFLICITNVSADNIIDTKICKKTRNLSSVLFLTHILFLAILGNGLHIWNTTIRFLCTLFLAGVSLLIIKRINSNWINWLFMLR